VAKKYVPVQRGGGWVKIDEIFRTYYLNAPYYLIINQITSNLAFIYLSQHDMTPNGVLMFYLTKLNINISG